MYSIENSVLDCLDWSSTEIKTPEWFAFPRTNPFGASAGSRSPKRETFRGGPDAALADKVRRDMERNGTYFPQVKSVVFSLKTEESVPVKDANGEDAWTEGGSRPDGKASVRRKARETKRLEYPILTTIVTFEDGSKSKVSNSKDDPVTVIKEKLADGSTVEVADAASKERGIVYAVIKRLIVPCSGPGYVSGEGYAKAMKWLASKSVAVDQNLARAKARVEKQAKKSAPAENKTAKRKRYSAADVIQMLGEALTRNPNMING